jgi:SNF2 family DNA or RNA helicase
MIWKTLPYEHQLECWKQSARKPAYALFMEQGTGKTKVSIDTANWQFSKGLIKHVLVICPNGLQYNWVNGEMQTHYPHPYLSHIFTTKKSKKYVIEWNDFLKPNRALKILAVNIEAFRNKANIDKIKDYLKEDTLCIIDESTIIKNHKAQQTKGVYEIKDLCKFRRILSGTPFAQSMLDGWGQAEFLGNIFPHTNYYSFEADFAIKQEIDMGGRLVKIVVGYKNKDTFANYWKPNSFRIKKSECLDLPEKIYKKVNVPMSDEQKKVYNNLVDFALSEVNGSVVSTQHAISLMIKLHQVVCGSVKDDNGENKDLKCPRLDTLIALVKKTEGKVIIWAHYKRDIERIQNELSKHKFKSVTYYGEIGKQEREEGLQLFKKDEEIKCFIANKAASKGLTINEANTCIYYSNSYELEVRLQSEDRPHRIGQTKNVEYIDLICPDTIDEQIIQALKDKNDISNSILNQLKSIKKL